MIENILGAIGTSFDVISAIILGLTLGFSAMPTAFSFLVAGVGMLIFSQVSIISIPAEHVILINRFTKDRNERSCIILYAGIITLILGVTGIIGVTMDFVGEIILCAIMSGVGLMVFGIAIGMLKENALTSGISIASAFIMYFLTQNVIYTAVVSIIVSSVITDIIKRKEIKNQPKSDLSNENFKLIRPKFNLVILRGALALSTLFIGGIISDGTITAQMAGMDANQNFLSIISGSSNIVSALFGGMPVGFIVSGTGAAPDPLLSGLFVMVIMFALLIFRIVPRISRFIPNQSVSGLLIVLATFLIIPQNALTAFQGDPIVATVTTATTAFVDPFIGMIAGIVTRLITGLIGI